MSCSGFQWQYDRTALCRVFDGSMQHGILQTSATAIFIQSSLLPNPTPSLDTYPCPSRCSHARSPGVVPCDTSSRTESHGSIYRETRSLFDLGSPQSQRDMLLVALSTHVSLNTNPICASLLYYLALLCELLHCVLRQLAPSIGNQLDVRPSV